MDKKGREKLMEFVLSLTAEEYKQFYKFVFLNLMEKPEDKTLNLVAQIVHSGLKYRKDMENWRKKKNEVFEVLKEIQKKVKEKEEERKLKELGLLEIKLIKKD